MSGLTPTTPKAKTPFTPTTPATARVLTTHGNIVQPSPHYATTRRHSLYGVEDRVVIDPGSRIWKVGFSGEGRPRDVFYARQGGCPLWKLHRAADPVERAEEDKLLEVRLQQCLRSVFHNSLLTDPKARKVILIEHPLLPLYIKDIIARILFENQVPSVSFASNHLLGLLAVGRITGLVLDTGHLESVALPIFAARPLFSQIRTTPLAGARLTSHLRALLLLFGTYLPPPTSLSAATSIPAANRSTRVPQEVLTDEVIEEIKTRCCFVGEALSNTNRPSNTHTRGPTPANDDSSDIDVPPPSDATHSESEFSHAGIDSTVSSQRETSSEFSIISNPRGEDSHHHHQARGGEGHLQALATMYTRYSTSTDLQMRVMPPPAQQMGTGRGTLIIPGWIRERAAEVLFEGGDVDESSVAEVLLDALLKVPVDLRKTLASSILVIGGTAMLPGFIPRLHAELLRAVSPPSPTTSSPPHTSSPLPSTMLSSSSTSRHQQQPTTRRTPKHARPRPPSYDRYAALRPLLHYFAIMNNPSPPPPATGRAAANAGKAPAFTPATMAWVGGSLAGALKTGGVEVPREKWDEADAAENDEEDDGDDAMDVGMGVGARGRDTAAGGDAGAERPGKFVLPDWTRTPLPVGAPSASAAATAAAPIQEVGA